MKLKLPLNVAILCTGLFLGTGLWAMPETDTPGIRAGRTGIAVTADAATLQASSLQDFGATCINTVSAPQQLELTGTDLTTANVQVGPVAGYKFSLSEGGTYTNSLSITQDGGIFSATVYVVFAPQETGTSQVNIPILGGGASSITVAASGIGVNAAPSVTGTFANALTTSTAKMGGTVSASGCGSLIEKGVVYSTAPGVTIGGPNAIKVMHGDTSIGSFSIIATGLTGSTTYYVRAYAKNNGGTTYGAETSFSTAGIQSPEALPATNILPTAFTANWEAAEGAQKYYLDVATSADFGLTSIVPAYSNVEVYGTSINVSGLLTMVNNYYYRVRAYANGTTTGNSNVILVKVPNYWNGTAWSLGTPPTIDDRAVVMGDYSTAQSGTITAYNLAVNMGHVTVDEGTSVTLRNELTVSNGATFEVASDAHLVQTDIAPINNSGNIIVHRNSGSLYRLDYTMWASPVTSTATLQQFSPQTLANRFYVYDTAQNIFKNNSSGAINPAADGFGSAKGYLIRTPDNHTAFPEASVWAGTFTGVPNNGDINFTLSNIGNGQRYNLVGNPYPSALSLDNFLIDNIDRVTGTVWYWRKTNGAAGSAYVTYSGGTFSNGPAPAYIQPGQGFIIEAVPGATQLMFRNSQRMSQNGNFFRMSPQAISQAEKHRIWLNLSDASGVIGNMAVAYMAGATAGIDAAMDGKSFNDSAIALASYVEGEEFSVQGRALPFTDTDVVPLSFKTDTAGNFTISINAVDGLFADNQDIYLRDNLNGTVTNLKNSAYSFGTAAGTFTNRFEIVYNTNALDREQPIADINNVMVWKQGRDINITAGLLQVTGITVYDLNGRMLYNRDNLNVSETTIQGIEAAQQLLIVEVNTTFGTVSKKVAY